MIKKYTNYILTLTILLSITHLAAEDSIGNVTEEANQLKQEVNVFSEQLLQSYLNDSEINGGIKEKGLRLLNQAKIKDSDVEKLMNDPDVSEFKKAKALKKLKKLADKAKAKYCKEHDDALESE